MVRISKVSLLILFSFFFQFVIPFHFIHLNQSNSNYGNVNTFFCLKSQIFNRICVYTEYNFWHLSRDDHQNGMACEANEFTSMSNHDMRTTYQRQAGINQSLKMCARVNFYCWFLFVIAGEHLSFDFKLYAIRWFVLLPK